MFLIHASYKPVDLWNIQKTSLICMYLLINRRSVKIGLFTSFKKPGQIERAPVPSNQRHSRKHPFEKWTRPRPWFLNNIFPAPGLPNAKYKDSFAATHSGSEDHKKYLSRLHDVFGRHFFIILSASLYA